MTPNVLENILIDNLETESTVGRNDDYVEKLFYQPSRYVLSGKTSKSEDFRPTRKESVVIGE